MANYGGCAYSYFNNVDFEPTSEMDSITANTLAGFESRPAENFRRVSLITVQV